MRVNGRYPRKRFYSHRHTATSYLHTILLADGSPAVKEDVERYLPGHAEKVFTPDMESDGSRR